MVASSNEIYTSSHINYTFARAAAEIQSKYEEISVETILNDLGDKSGMPTPNYALLESVASKDYQPAMYDPFIEAMQPYLKKGWVLVNTSNHTDPSTVELFGEHEIKPDIGLYTSSRDGKSITQASEAELFGEFKLATEDEPFRLATLDSKGKEMPLEVDSLRAGDTRGQIALYINAIQATQQRTRVFAFYIRANLCRLLCHSRAGTRVTPLFDYTELPYLHQFFWRLSHTSPDGRGHDATFERIGAETQDPVAEPARVELEISSTDPLYKVSVDDRVFYVSQPFTRTHLYPVGRGTRCFSAYDPVLKRVVLLKDTWRITDYQEEHLTYKKLREHLIQNIPEVVAAGAVGGKFHKTTVGGRKHEHYRIVLNVVGKPLYTATSSHQFTMALLCAFIAHWQAWECAGILHRDISIGNIIIVDGKGMLIDWERAKSKDDTEVRTLERTGTWQFMSVRILENPDTVHEVRDDIESFLHVALWISARYVPNAMTPNQRSSFLKQFDFEAVAPEASKQTMLLVGRGLLTKLKLITPAFEKLMGDLLATMSFLHNPAALDAFKEISMDITGYADRMLTHEWMAKTIETALSQESWKVFVDPLEDHKLADPVDSNEKRKKDYLDAYHSAGVKKRRIDEDDAEDLDQVDSE